MRPALRRKLERALAAACAACLLGPAAAEPPGDPAPAPGTAAGEAAAAPDASAVWQQRLEQAQQRIELAHERVGAAQAAYSRARHDRNPRGAALATIEEERRAAEHELRAAEIALPELVEQAHREGVPPAVLDPYEE